MPALFKVGLNKFIKDEMEETEGMRLLCDGLNNGPMKLRPDHLPHAPCRLGANCTLIHLNKSKLTVVCVGLCHTRGHACKMILFCWPKNTVLCAACENEFDISLGDTGHSVLLTNEGMGDDTVKSNVVKEAWSYLSDDGRARNAHWK